MSDTTVCANEQCSEESRYVEVEIADVLENEEIHAIISKIATQAAEKGGQVGGQVVLNRLLKEATDAPGENQYEQNGKARSSDQTAPDSSHEEEAAFSKTARFFKTHWKGIVLGTAALASGVLFFTLRPEPVSEGVKEEEVVDDRRYVEDIQRKVQNL